MTKLNKIRIKWLISQVIRKGRKPSEVASVFDLSVRRFNNSLSIIRREEC
ncbi:hypothetical protein KY347_06310 [Candidatus Woesearchaeota archaeon]|nr:hypothetical protein [Candidatus Woesearchaeota archaeon]